jgi:hypothetical protein
MSEFAIATELEEIRVINWVVENLTSCNILDDL